MVLKRFREIELVISPEKCTWSDERVEFVGYVIILQGMEMAEEQNLGYKGVAVQVIKGYTILLGLRQLLPEINTGFPKDFWALNRVDKG
jgi:hypothetical protein